MRSLTNIKAQWTNMLRTGCVTVMMKEGGKSYFSLLSFTDKLITEINASHCFMIPKKEII